MAASTIAQEFLSNVEQILFTQGEILVETCYTHSAGNRDFFLTRSFQEFQKRLSTLSPRTLVNVYRRYNLPLRGEIDEGLIQSAISLLPEHAEYLIVYLHPRDDWRLTGKYEKEGGWLSSFRNDEGQAALEEDLRDSIGEQAAIGSYPDWCEQSYNVFWAVVPNTDGSVQVGVY